jgi:replicative DNA helicase
MNDDTVRMMPHSLEAEKCLLGVCLRRNEVIPDVMSLIAVNDLYADAHQKVFEVLVTRYDQGKQTDSVLLAETLKQRGQIDDVGYELIGELWNLGSTSVEQYAELVRDKSTLRCLMLHGQKTYGDACQQTAHPEELLDEAQRSVLAIGEQRLRDQTKSADTVGQAFCEQIDLRCREKTLRGLQTGFTDLDRYTSGLQRGELIVVGARPAIGKTTLGLNIATHAFLKEKAPVLFISLEQSELELFERVACARSGVDYHRLRKGMVSEQDGEKLFKAAAEIRKAPWFIDPTPALNMLKIASNARRHKLRHGIRLLVVDYLQLIEPDNRKDPRHEQVGVISRRLKCLAKELQIPVMVMAQLNRSSEDRHDQKPRLSDLRESGSIEQDADVVILLHRPDENADLIRVHVAKQRNGRTGEFALYFRGAFMRFETYGEEEPFAGREF